MQLPASLINNVKSANNLVFSTIAFECEATVTCATSSMRQLSHIHRAEIKTPKNNIQ